MGRSMSWRIEGRLCVVVHTAQSPTNLEWQRFLIETTTSAAPADGRIIVLSRGGGPDGEQRKALSVAVGNRPKPRLALLTDSLLARTGLAAMRLLNPSMKAFGTKDVNEAFEFLKLSVAERERVAKLLVELENELGERTVEQPPTRSGTR
jgi:hypothetical protein